MIKSRTLLYVITAFLMAACAAKSEKQGNNNEVGTTVGLDRSFSLALQDSVQLSDGETHFWLQLEAVEENRCPADVNCITGGRAIVWVRLENKPEQLAFCIGADCREEEEHSNSFLVEYNNRSYTIVLEEVAPYPQTGNERAPKQAIFKIKRATS